MFANGFGNPFPNNQGNAAGPPAAAGININNNNINNGNNNNNNNNNNGNNNMGANNNPAAAAAAAQQAAGGMNGMGYNNNNMFNMGFGVGGAVPNNFANMYGIGLGYQQLGGAANNAGGGVNMGNAFPMPPGVPPANAAGAQFAFPPMMGAVPGQHMPINTFPPPPPTCARLGKVCYEHGPQDLLQVSAELAKQMHQVSAANYTPQQLLNELCNASRPVVLLTMSPVSAQVLPFFGLSKYNSAGGMVPMLDGRYFGFIGNGNTELPLALHLLPQDTVDAVGMVRTGYAMTDANLNAKFGMAGRPTTLLAEAVNGDMGVSQTVFPAFALVPNAWVYLFTDGPHPYVALQRVKRLTQLLPTTDQHNGILLESFLRQACHRGSTGNESCLAYRWESAMMFGGSDSTFMAHTEAYYHSLVPRPLQQAQAGESVNMDEVRKLVSDELKSKNSSDDTRRGCRRMKPDEVALCLALSDLESDTPREDWTLFMKNWENTQCNEPSMRTMLAKLIAASATTLRLPNTVRYLQPVFVKSIMHLVFGLGLDDSWTRSHRGVTAAAVHFMRGTAEQAAQSEELGSAMESATHTTPDDESKRQGKPGTAPQGIRDLIEALDVFLIHWHALFTLKGAHAQEVIKIRNILREKYVPDGLKLTQDQVEDIFWTIFLDGRRCTQNPEEAGYSALSGLRIELQGRCLVPRIGVPHSSLSPGGTRGADSLDSSLGAHVGESPPKKARRGYGAIDHHNSRLKLKWATVCEKNGNPPLLLNFVKRIEDGNGGFYTLQSFGQELVEGNKCIIGTVTGSCTKSGCTKDHAQRTSDNEAAKICRVLDKGLATFNSLKKEG